MRKLLQVISLICTVILTTGAGYVGTLPDLEAEFSHLKKQESKKAQEPFSIEELDKMHQEKLKPIPRDNDLYVDIIVKKDKSTKYFKDINEIIIILEKLRKCINTDQDIQRFNGITSNLIDHVAYLHEEYKDKPEANYLSYNKLGILSNEARDVANFRSQGLATQQYLPYTSDNNIYTKENLQEKLKKLLNNVNETIFILKNLE